VNKKVVMGFMLAIILAVPLTAHARAQDQATASGRIEGRVMEASGAVLPGVQVTLIGIDAVTRLAVSGNDGRFVFDGVQPGAPYVIRGQLTGFRSDSVHDIAVTGGQTRTIDLELEVGCVDEPGIRIPDLDELLGADAIAHVRVGDVVEDEHDGCGTTHEAVVINAVRFSNAAQRISTTFRLLGTRRFDPGKEYLLFLSSYGAKHPRTVASFERAVVGGRVRGARAGDLEIRSGMPIGKALTRLREVRERYSRYRNYGTQVESTGLETLRFKTGWVLAGVISHGSWVSPSFGFVDGVTRPPELPRPKDRIRITTDETVYILEFGAKGEARRLRRPTIRHLSISDDTGTHAEAGLVYTVADVQLESIREEGRQFAWVRIVAR
jgi:hypothetical protein